MKFCLYAPHLWHPIPNIYPSGCCAILHGKSGHVTSLPELGKASSQSHVIWSCTPCSTYLKGKVWPPQINSNTLPPTSPSLFPIAFSVIPEDPSKLSKQIQPHDIYPLSSRVSHQSRACLNLHNKIMAKKKKVTILQLFCSQEVSQANWLCWINWRCLPLCDIYF